MFHPLDLGWGESPVSEKRRAFRKRDKASRLSDLQASCSRSFSSITVSIRRRSSTQMLRCVVPLMDLLLRSAQSVLVGRDSTRSWKQAEWNPSSYWETQLRKPISVRAESHSYESGLQSLLITVELSRPSILLLAFDKAINSRFSSPTSER